MNKVQMTEMQKAYYIGREDASYGTTGTHLYVEIVFEGEPNEVEVAFNKVIINQPYLRARISDDFQFCILDELKYQIEVICGEYDDVEAVSKVREELSHKVYTQRDFPLFTLKMLGDNHKYRLFFSIDMLIADGLSLFQICREIKNNIADPELKCTNRMSDLLYMSDFYQKNRMSNRYIKSRDYYMKKLDNIYMPPALGYKSNSSDGKFAHLEERISEEEFLKLCSKAMDKELSPTDILFTAYATVLAKWSRFSKMSINTTSFIRPKGDLYRTVIGDFTTSMLVQAEIDWNKTFYDNARTIKKALFVAYKNNMFEVPELVRELSKKNPGITMPVVFTSMLFDIANLWDDTFKCDYTISQTSQVNLDSQVKKIGRELNITWDYRKDMFDQMNIEKMFGEYIEVIRLFVNSDKDVIEEYKSQMVTELSGLYRRYNKVGASERLELSASLKQCFEETVNKNYNKTFIYIDNESYSFGWVYEKASALAARIDEELIQNNRKKIRIAFVGKKDIQSFVTIIAAILSGNSFCAINEDYGDDKKEDTLSELDNYLLIEAGKFILSNSDKKIDDDEAYVLFTSGTTGKPKGIIINEKAALNTVIAINQMLGVNSDDKILNISNLYFDLSIYDIFAAMILGAEIISVHPMLWSQLDIKKTNEITIWNSTPALVKEYALKSELKSIRAFMMSGDFVPTKLVQDLYELFSKSVQVLSLGGATEASIWSIFYNCAGLGIDETVPYGYPLPAQEMYVVNQDTGLLCPQSVLGEICISGEGLADGYLDKEQTKQSFVHNENLGKTIYKTGDLGYLGINGILYIVGRVAQEIKHNGYRIDLLEIQKYINSVETVTNSMVFIERESDTRTKLIAIVESNNRSVDDEIRRFLSENLPYYMIPSVIMVIKKFPLTINGKIDTGELKRFFYMAEDSKEEFSDEQKRMLEVWKKVIADDYYIEIQNQDSTYFDAGGQSLQAVDLRNRIADEFNVDISLQDVLSNITLRSMTDMIKNRKIENSSDELENVHISNQLGELVLLKKGTTNKNVVLVHGGTGEVNLFVNVAKYFDEKYSVYGIRKIADVSSVSPKVMNFKMFAESYITLVEQLGNVDILGGWCIGGSIAYEMSLIRPDKFRYLLLINSESPMIDPPLFQGFTVQDEIQILQQYSTIPLNAEEFSSIDAVWEKVVTICEYDDNLRLKLIESLPVEVIRILPPMKELDARSTLYQINNWRSAYEARNHYAGRTRSGAHMVYLNALEDPMDNYTHWEDFFETVQFIDIPGNHTSLFLDENVSIWANIINKMISE